jgi:hypothetical protein
MSGSISIVRKNSIWKADHQQLLTRAQENITDKPARKDVLLL